ncbi:indole-3-glycerol phosphate synthase TrpC [Chloroflexota bacterium]
MVLDQIVAHVREGLAQRKQQTPLEQLELSLDYYGAPRDFGRALRSGRVEIIAEIKRASPSKGWLNQNLDVPKLAVSYARSGAAAISVLTEPEWFKGDPAYLTAARQMVKLPLLCKDFILEPYQIYEARSHGADAILLITSLLSSFELSELIEVARSLDMAALVEVHNEQELKKALDARVKLIGINNRNLADFSVDLGTTLRLRSLIPPNITVVSESGIKSYEDISILQKNGVNAVLVGETLVSSSDPEAKLRELKGEHR